MSDGYCKNDLRFLVCQNIFNGIVNAHHYKQFSKVHAGMLIQYIWDWLINTIEFVTGIKTQFYTAVVAPPNCSTCQLNVYLQYESTGNLRLLHFVIQYDSLSHHWNQRHVISDPHYTTTLHLLSVAFLFTDNSVNFVLGLIVKQCLCLIISSIQLQ